MWNSDGSADAADPSISVQYVIIWHLVHLHDKPGQICRISVQSVYHWRPYSAVIELELHESGTR